MFYLEIFIAMVLFFIVVFLFLIVLEKFTDWIEDKWNSEIALFTYISIYIPSVITLFVWLLGGGQ